MVVGAQMPDEQRDYFISFNSADEAYAKAISDALRAEGFTTFFHPDDLDPGGYVPKWMDDALRGSRQMLALCSPKYMDEGAVYSEAERYAWFWRDTRGEKFKLIPVVLQKVELPPIFAVYRRLTVTSMTPVQAAIAIVAALKKPEENKERQSLRGIQPSEVVLQSAYVHTTGLPETGYERLVGRDAELGRLDKAWLDAKINILSLVAEGGAGKSALVNEWIKRMQAHNYPGAELVLGWSFYSQGTTERAASAEEFLNWMLEKLGIMRATTSASAKADAIAEAMMRRRVLLLLDGVEPLQQGPGPQLGQLKDLGLRALLRRFAATPPGAKHGLIVLTSRLVVKDIARWQDGAAPVQCVEQLSNGAGAALLHDNGVVGTDKDLKAASHDFGGHPLALGLLASFLKETQTGDVRRRDHIRTYLADVDNPCHDHARRVMESYEKDWLTGQPVLLATMYIMGLFDRPASSDCLSALRAEPAIKGFTDQIIMLDDAEWRRVVTRLREVRLLSPLDPSAPQALDAHPLVREWFGERLRQVNDTAWKAAHGRLYEHLRDTTKEGDTPSIKDLAPLYQAIAHGCRAERHQEVLDKVFKDRIFQRRSIGRLKFYSMKKLGAFGSDLAAVSWFFDKAYEVPVITVNATEWPWLLSVAAFTLRAQGRFAEARPAERGALRMAEDAKNWRNAAIGASNLAESEEIVGEISSAIATAEQSVVHADHSGDEVLMMLRRSMQASALQAAGQTKEAERFFSDAERRQKKQEPALPLYSVGGYRYCEMLLSKGDYAGVRDRAMQTLAIARDSNSLLDIGLDTLTLGRAHLALALENVDSEQSAAAKSQNARTSHAWLDQAVEKLSAAGSSHHVPRGYLARAAFRRGVGDWNGAARDLEEVEEIAEPGPMRLHLCDMAIERTRLAFAQMEAFAPLSGLTECSSPKPEQLGQAECKSLFDEARKQLAIAADYIEKCGYHRRDDELAELQAVLHGEKTFAELPPRV
jgi:tetratricopeptide (TPR) repeat protein